MESENETDVQQPEPVEETEPLSKPTRPTRSAVKKPKTQSKPKPYVYGPDSIEQFARLINKLQLYLELDSDQLQELMDTIEPKVKEVEKVEEQYKGLEKSTCTVVSLYKNDATTPGLLGSISPSPKSRSRSRSPSRSPSPSPSPEQETENDEQSLRKFIYIPQKYLDPFPDYSLLDFTNILVGVLKTDRDKYQVVNQANDQADAESKAKLHTELMSNYYVMCENLLNSYSSPLTKSKSSKKPILQRFGRLSQSFTRLANSDFDDRSYTDDEFIGMLQYYIGELRSIHKYLKMSYPDVNARTSVLLEDSYKRLYGYYNVFNFHVSRVLPSNDHQNKIKETNLPPLIQELKAKAEAISKSRRSKSKTINNMTVASFESSNMISLEPVKLETNHLTASSYADTFVDGIKTDVKNELVPQLDKVNQALNDYIKHNKETKRDFAEHIKGQINGLINETEVNSDKITELNRNVVKDLLESRLTERKLANSITDISGSVDGVKTDIENLSRELTYVESAQKHTKEFLSDCITVNAEADQQRYVELKTMCNGINTEAEQRDAELAFAIDTNFEHDKIVEDRLNENFEHDKEVESEVKALRAEVAELKSYVENFKQFFALFKKL